MHVNWHTHFRSWHVLWLVKKKNHTSIDTLEFEMTRITRQLEYCKLQLKYLENITHNSSITSYTHLHTYLQLFSCNFLCDRELRRWSEIVRLTRKKARQCERRFSKQNAIKNHLHNRLNLKTLICGFLFVGLKFMQWIGLPSSTFGETCETEGYLRSIDIFFCYKSRLHIDYSKY